MTHYWNHLLNTALLGTDKQSLDISQLPEILQEAVSQADRKDKEAFFYKTAALAWQYQKAGTQPQKADFPAIPIAEAEEKPYTSAQSLHILNKILADDNLCYTLLEMWAEKCVQRSEIVPPEKLVQFLNIGSKLKKEHKFLQEKLLQVIGKRGLWLGQFNTEWSFLQTPDYQYIWDEGKTVERIEAFRFFRKTNPTLAREMLKKSWETENIAAKRDLLACIEINLSEEDEAFLHEIYLNITAARVKKKDVYTDLLRKIVDLLFSLPDSRLSQATFEKVKRYLYTGKEKKLLGLISGKIKLNLPEKEDGFFNTENMYQNFGFDKISNKVSSHTDVAYWFEELVSLFSPAFWQKYLDINAEETVKVFLQNESFAKGKTKLFKNAFSQAVFKHKHSEFAKILVKESEPEIPFNLLKLLSEPEVETFIRKHGVWNVELEEVLLAKSTAAWSLELSESIFKKIAKNNYYTWNQDKQFIEKAIRFLHPKVIKAVPDLLLEETQDWQKQQWKIQIVQPLAKMLEIRQEIEAL